jgi:hypothetical protein
MGEEILLISYKTVIVERNFWEWIRPKKFQIEFVKDIRRAPVEKRNSGMFYRSRYDYFSFNSWNQGLMTFDYGAKTIKNCHSN